MIKEIHIQSAISQKGRPFEVEVNGGTVINITIDQDAVDNYGADDFLELLQVAGIEVSNLLIPFPPQFNSRFKLVPGNFQVKHIGKSIELPTEAFQYFKP